MKGAGISNYGIRYLLQSSESIKQKLIERLELCEFEIKMK